MRVGLLPIQPSKEPRVLILEQGAVTLAHVKDGETTGYMCVGNDKAVCFYVDINNRGYPFAFMQGTNECPIIMLSGSEEDDTYTSIFFPDFEGWKVHAARGGKVLSVALVRYEEEDYR